MPEALPQNWSEDCCRGGLLSPWAIDPSNSVSSFEMKVGNLAGNFPAYKPQNLTLMALGPGYTLVAQFWTLIPQLPLILEEEDKIRF